MVTSLSQNNTLLHHWLLIVNFKLLAIMANEDLAHMWPSDSPVLPFNIIKALF